MAFDAQTQKQGQPQIIVSTSIPSINATDQFWYNPSDRSFNESISNQWIPVGSGGKPFGRQIIRVHSDFLGGVIPSEFSSGVQNGGTITHNSVTEAACPGIVNIGTGSTNSSGQARVSSSSFNQILFGGATWIGEFYLKTPASLSTSTEAYHLYCGFSNGFFVYANAVVAHYTHTYSSGVWRFVCRSNSVESIFDTSDLVLANTWYRITITVNGAANEAKMFINGVLKATITTNIPSVVGRQVGYIAAISKANVGTAARTFDLDYVEIVGLMNSLRG